jgi:hypothetical protein
LWGHHCRRESELRLRRWEGSKLPRLNHRSRNLRLCILFQVGHCLPIQFGSHFVICHAAGTGKGENFWQEFLLFRPGTFVLRRRRLLYIFLAWNRDLDLFVTQPLHTACKTFLNAMITRPIRIITIYALEIRKIPFKRENTARFNRRQSTHFGVPLFPNLLFPGRRPCLTT